MLNFIEKVPISDVQGSEYNPRVITQEALEQLQQSIRRFGMVKPLIVNETNNVIVAGHQRQKAAQAIGLEHLPCIMIRAPKLEDEIHFNLLHNSIETSKTTIRLEECKVGGYAYCPPEKIVIESDPQNVFICSQISTLMSGYGEWGSVVTDADGNVLLNAEYAYCAKKHGYGVLTYGIPNEDVPDFLEYIGIEYGKYNYDNLGIKTYHQFMAQMRRRSTDGRRTNTSTLYEKYLIPQIQKSDSIIDVGAGRLAYFKLVKSMGYNIHAYEPSLVTKGSNTLDMRGIVAYILRTEQQVRAHGLFDWCVLEFVINSIVDNEFEKAVLILCNAVLKSTGTLLTCTRNIEGVRKTMEQKECTAGKGIALYCLDENGYSLSISNGIAFKQKFHTRESYVALLEQFFGDVQVLACNSNTIYCSCTKPRQLPREVYDEYLEKELNIEYPGGFKHNKHKGLMQALIEGVEKRYEGKEAPA